jgi:hypothetical protein
VVSKKLVKLRVSAQCILEDWVVPYLTELFAVTICLGHFEAVLRRRKAPEKLLGALKQRELVAQLVKIRVADKSLVECLIVLLQGRRVTASDTDEWHALDIA